MKQITDFVRGLALGVAVGLLLSSAIPARADTKIELGTGLTLYGHHGDGVWHQRDYGPYDIKDRAANLSVGLTGDVFGWRWRAGAQYLGRYGSVCRCLSSDRAYEEYRKGNDVGGWRRASLSARRRLRTWPVLPEWHIGKGWFLQGEVGIGYPAQYKVRVHPGAQLMTYITCDGRRGC
ncbi:hypothetical protein [Casimicrobium huifangae]|uniref:hypothetical protein n=1 Tax=Casimicrobium huifangae TaxID=2591109 RepID=UPI0037834367